MSVSDEQREALAKAHAWCPECNGSGMVGTPGAVDDCPNLDVHRAIVAALGWSPAGVLHTTRERLTAIAAEHPGQEYVENGWPEGPWAGFGWICTGCGARIEYQGLTIPAGVTAGAWAMAAHQADALLAPDGPLTETVDREQSIPCTCYGPALPGHWEKCPVRLAAEVAERRGAAKALQAILAVAPPLNSELSMDGATGEVRTNRTAEAYVEGFQDAHDAVAALIKSYEAGTR